MPRTRSTTQPPGAPGQQENTLEASPQTPATPVKPPAPTQLQTPVKSPAAQNTTVKIKLKNPGKTLPTPGPPNLGATTDSGVQESARQQINDPLGLGLDGDGHTRTSPTPHRDVPPTTTPQASGMSNSDDAYIDQRSASSSKGATTQLEHPVTAPATPASQPPRKSSALNSQVANPKRHPDDTLESPMPKRQHVASAESQDQASRISFHKANKDKDRDLFDSLQSEDLDRLEDGKGSLNAVLIETFLHCWTTAAVSCATINNSSLKDNPDSKYKVCFLERGLDTTPVATIALCLQVHESHFVLVWVDTRKKTATLYDSLRDKQKKFEDGPAFRAADSALKSLAQLLPHGPEGCTTFDIRRGFCRQGNGYDSGVYTLAIACFLIAGHEIPKKINTWLWRAILLAMARKSTLRSALPFGIGEFSTDLGEPSDPTDPNDPNDPNDPSDPSDPSDPPSQAELEDDTPVQQCKREFVSGQKRVIECIVQYGQREEDIEILLEHLDQVFNALATLAEMAQERCKNLASETADLEHDIKAWHTIEATFQALASKPSGPVTLLQAIEQLQALEFKGKHYQTKKENCEVLVAQTKALKLDTVVEDLKHNQTKYNAERIKACKAVYGAYQILGKTLHELRKRRPD